MKVEPINISPLELDMACVNFPGYLRASKYFRRKAYTELTTKYLDYLRDTKKTLLYMDTFLDNYLENRVPKGSRLHLCKLRRMWDENWDNLTNEKAWKRYIVEDTDLDKKRTFKELDFETTKQLADASDKLMSTRQQVATIVPYISHKSADIIQKIKDNFKDPPKDGIPEEEQLLWELVFVVIRGTAESCAGLCQSMSRRDGYLDYMRAQLGIMWYQVQTTLKALKLN